MRVRDAFAQWNAPEEQMVRATSNERKLTCLIESIVLFMCLITVLCVAGLVFFILGMVATPMVSVHA